MSNRAGDGTEGGGGFAFAVTGKYHDQPAFLLGGGDPRIDFVFYPLLALAVALIAHWEIRFTPRLGIEGHTGFAPAIVAHQP